MRYHGGLGTSGYLDFSVNVPSTPDPELIDRFRKDLDTLHRYPYIEETVCTRRFERFHGRPIVFGNGATQLIYALVRALQPRSALVPEPTFTEYRRALESIGCAIRDFDALSAGARRMDAIAERAAGADLVVLCNPNNPDGFFAPISEIRGLLARCECTVMLDESFIDFVAVDPIGHAAELRDLMAEFPDRLAVIRSLTKSYSIPGVRAGYLIADEETASRVLGQIEPWSLNRFAITALDYIGERYFDDPAALRAHTAALDASKRRELLRSSLTAPRFLLYESSANFALMRTGEAALNRRLHAAGCHIRSCGDFRYLTEFHYRIALLDEPKLEKLIRAIGEEVDII